MKNEMNDDSISHFYDDDFESDSEDEAAARKENKSSLKTKKAHNLGRSLSDTQATLTRSRLKRKALDKPVPLKRNSNLSEEIYVTQRLLSARQHKITELRNEIKNMERQLKEVCDENRLLKRLHARQEKELTRLNTAKSELPNIMESHTQELQAVRKQLRRQKEKNREIMESVKAKEAEILQLKNDLKILNHLCQQKDLMEREELKKKVEKLEQELSYQATTSQELSRKLDLASKLHKQELATERAQLKQTKDMLDQFQHHCNELNILLKDKELKLERNFIYSQREKKPWKSIKSASSECTISEQQAKPLSSLPPTPTKVNNKFGIAEEAYNMTESYEDISDIQNNDYWSQITQEERHKAISQGEQLLHDISRQQLLDTEDVKERVLENVRKDSKENNKFLFPIKSASTESIGNNGTFSAKVGQSYSSLALTNFSQSEPSKENTIPHHSSLNNSPFLLSEESANHDYSDPNENPNAVDSEDNALGTSFHRNNSVNRYKLISGQNGVKDEQPPLPSTVAEQTRSLAGDEDSDSLLYQSNPSKRQDDACSSWLPDIFQQSVNLH